MTSEKSWDLFFQTGLPEAYLLAKHPQRQQKKPDNAQSVAKAFQNAPIMNHEL